MILDGDRHELGQYVREVANMCGLRDWMVGIADDPPEDEEANAQVDVPFGRRCAMIRFKPSWAEVDPEELRQTVVHELVHCHLWSLDQRASDLYGTLKGNAYMLYHKAHHEALELAVDAIAQAWAEFLPLPIKSEQEAG